MGLENKTVSFIGSGIMAEAMIKGLLNQKLLTAEQLIAAEPLEDRGHELEARYGLRHTLDNAEAAGAADILVFSTKPQVIGAVMHSLKGQGSKPSLVLSILAGVRIGTLMDGTGKSQRGASDAEHPRSDWRGDYGMDGDAGCAGC